MTVRLPSSIALALALMVPAYSPVLAAQGDPPTANDCSGNLDFRLVGSWVSDDLEERSFLPTTRSQTPDGLPVTTKSCMVTPDDVEEVSFVEVAPHLRSVTERHYHIGFIGLDRILVTFPNGAMHVFARIIAAPKQAFDAVTHRNRPAATSSGRP